MAGTKKVTVVGAGFSGLSAAACLGAEGFDVTVLEKNDTAGGRARLHSAGGFNFDMGPSWYWMPDVFEKFFKRFGKSASDYYELKRLDPSYRIYYGKRDFTDVPAGVPPICRMFESMETGGGERLMKFLEEAAFCYKTGMDEMVFKPGLSWREFADFGLIKRAWRLNIFQSHAKLVRKYFKHPRLIQLLEFPILFLGASPDKIPALYALMNYADMGLGTWYPTGGMHRVVEAMVAMAAEHGVRFRYNTPVSRIVVEGKLARGVWSGDTFIPSDYIVASADYRHVEKELLPAQSMQYSDNYWESRVLAPSCLIFYVGINKRVNALLHHTLFFDENIDDHLRQIYIDPQWPVSPQFYVCCPSKSDDSVAPSGCENLFILIPVAPGLDDDESVRERYFTMIIDRIEKATGESIAQNVVYKRSYAHSDFVADYNAFKGNAYGLANTLFQTANFKPRITNPNVGNLFYTGQFTVPGPGVPPSIISGQVVSQVVSDSCRKIFKNSGQTTVKGKPAKNAGSF